MMQQAGPQLIVKYNKMKKTDRMQKKSNTIFAVLANDQQLRIKELGMENYTP